MQTNKDFSESSFESVIEEIARQRAVNGKPVNLKPTHTIITKAQLEKYGDKYGLLERSSNAAE